MSKKYLVEVQRGFSINYNFSSRQQIYKIFIFLSNFRRLHMTSIISKHSGVPRRKAANVRIVESGEESGAAVVRFNARRKKTGEALLLKKRPNKLLLKICRLINIYEIESVFVALSTSSKLLNNIFFELRQDV